MQWLQNACLHARVRVDQGSLFPSRYPLYTPTGRKVTVIHPSNSSTNRNDVRQVYRPHRLSIVIEETEVDGASLRSRHRQSLLSCSADRISRPVQEQRRKEVSLRGTVNPNRTKRDIETGSKVRKGFADVTKHGKIECIVLLFSNFKRWARQFTLLFATHHSRTVNRLFSEVRSQWKHVWNSFINVALYIVSQFFLTAKFSRTTLSHLSTDYHAFGSHFWHTLYFHTKIAPA